MEQDFKLHAAGKFDLYIHITEPRGYFEHRSLGDEYSGGLWFKDNVLIDSDGMVELPCTVLRLLVRLGYTVPIEFY